MNQRLPTNGENAKQVQRIANAFALVTLLLILCITLFPFDFTLIGFATRLSAFMSPSLADIEGLVEDIQVNILLFIPVGYALAVLVRRRERNMLKTLMLVTAGGTLLSAGVELAQLFIPFRYSSLIDVGTNALGTIVGFFLHAILGGRLSRFTVRAVHHPRSPQAQKLLAITYAAYLVFIILLSLALQLSLRSDDLETKIHIEALGDDASNVPWNGTLSDIAVITDALDARESEQVFAAGGVANANLKRLVAEFSYRVAFADSPATSHSRETHRGGNRPSGYRPVSTRGAVEIYSTASATYGPFSIVATLARGQDSAPNDGRIATLGRGPGECELTFVQMNHDLAIRIRSMGTGVEGMKPQLIVPSLFADSLPHTFVLVYDMAGMRVYVDDVRQPYDITLGPGFVFTHRLFFWKKDVELSSVASRLHTPLYYAILFAPIGFMLSIAVRNFPKGAASIGIAIAAVVPPVLLERFLSKDIGRAFDWDYVLLTGCVIAASVLAFSFRQKSRRS